ncbi:HPP family protein [Nitrospirillum pindoramense]|uniref:CBS domain-containing membrane protein n=1 Tax=Nitrospirillum amazonense TaxID=28077 RepID=A0A560HBG0_9PROT|nr:HPP family protein [Nitrospirillum amazonense]TWB43697.1 CBS domain-containing membrane protein [Nitrospirillum amazonense]
MHPYLRSFRATQPALPPVERIRIVAGALLGILLTTLISRWWLGDGQGLPYLVAPIGASSVLVFAAPATPLAQPWAVFGGNVVSGLAGVVCARLIPDPVMAGAGAVALAVLGMSLLRCLHPPGGAVALTAVLGGPVIHAAGFSFILAPVAANTAILITMGLAFNNLTRHRYPHVAPAQPTPTARNNAGYTIADLDQVLAHYGEQLDVDRDDLDAVFRQVEARAYQRRHGDIRCGDIRSRVPAAVGPEDTVATVRGLMADYHMRSVPVTDETGRLLGVVPPQPASVAGRQGIRRLVQPAVAALASTPVVNILPAMTAGAHEAMVVDETGRLVGMVTTADLLSALYGNEAIVLAG